MIRIILRNTVTKLALKPIYRSHRDALLKRTSVDANLVPIY